MGEMSMLLKALWSAICALANALAYPFCVALAVLTAAGFITLAVCIDIEAHRDRERQSAESQK